MDCVSCHADTEFNRVAVDRSSGELTGTICVQCGDDFIPRADDAPVRSMATCSICGDPADVLFPKWDSIVETDDGRNAIEYTVTLTTPALCDECLDANRRSPRVQSPTGVETD